MEGGEVTSDLSQVNRSSLLAERTPLLHVHYRDLFPSGLRMSGECLPEVVEKR